MWAEIRRLLQEKSDLGPHFLPKRLSQIYPSELQLNKANTADTEAAFLNLHLSISNDIVSTKIYDTHDDFDFENCQFPIFRW